MPQTLAKLWEKVRRLRRRFKKGTPWVLFPASSKKEDNEDDEPHAVSTAALALNCEAVAAIVEHYGPNPVHILPLQKQALHILILGLLLEYWLCPTPSPGFHSSQPFPAQVEKLYELVEV